MTRDESPPDGAAEGKASDSPGRPVDDASGLQADPPRPIGERPRLRLWVGLLIVAAALSVVSLVIREIQVRETVYAKILAEKTETSRREFVSFFTPIQSQLQVIRTWGADGTLDLADAAALDARFIPMLQPVSWAAALMLVGSEGVEFRLARGEEGWASQHSASGAFHMQREEWYRGALGTETSHGLFWSGLDRGARGMEPALFASAAWETPEDQGAGRPRIAALGVSRDAIDEFTANLPVTENGVLVLTGARESVAWYAPSKAPTFEPSDYDQVLHPEDEWERLLSRVFYEWNAAGRPTGQPLRFKEGGHRWWAMFVRTFDRGGDDPPTDLCLLIPSKDLSTRLQTTTGVVTYALFAVIAVCVIGVIRMAFGYKKRLQKITRQRVHSDDSEAQLTALIAGGESDSLEFKSTMRWNLAMNKPGKEMELAWLKTVVAFLNTDGGTILLGVEDDGTIHGIEDDGFKNEDKYLLHFNNLINRHIGVEFARYLRFGLRSLGEKRIMVIDCVKCEEPAFLRIDDIEDFYVRIGPSSRKLSLRKTLEYLERA